MELASAYMNSKILFALLLATLSVLSVFSLIISVILSKKYKRSKRNNEEKSNALNELSRYYNMQFIEREGKYTSRLDTPYSELILDILQTNRMKLDEIEKKIQSKIQRNVAGDNELENVLYTLSQINYLPYVLAMAQGKEYDRYECVKNTLGDVVHSVRTPLSALILLVSEGKHKDNCSDDYLELIGEIEQYVHQINHALQIYSDVAKTNIDIEKKDVVFAEVLRKRIRLTIISSGKNVRYEENIEPFRVSQLAVGPLLYAIYAIVDNAIDFISDNGLIRITARNDKVESWVFIENNGPIIQQNLLRRIFDLGYSSRNSTGRGLAIAKRAVEEQLNGIIDADNLENNEGVRFTIYFEDGEIQNEERTNINP